MDDDNLLPLAIVGILGFGAYLYFTGRLGSPYAGRQGGLYGGSGGLGTFDLFDQGGGFYGPAGAAGGQSQAGYQLAGQPDQTAARVTQAASAGGLGAAAAIAAPGAASMAMVAIPVVGAAAGLLTWGIVEQGWFRGGEIGISVNPRRDRFIGQFGPGGFEANSGITVMHQQLNVWLGEANGEAATQALLGAESDEELTVIQKQIAAVYAQHGVRIATF